MTKLEKGMVVLSSVESPTGSPARIIYAGRGEGTQFGTTLFHVFIGDMSYGIFTLRGDITTVEEAQSKLMAPRREGDEETLAEYAVRYQWYHVDDVEGYALS
ncbi:hypothetical protein SCACP_11360 [Sporomusa carbonis]|uniref:hypothetical protein n=1 Tax=Sporomusa carbonis TaxID=3076075 RepID=UPI003A661507